MIYKRRPRRARSRCFPWYALLLFWLALPARADSIVISVEGVSGALRDNVLANLGLYQERERDLSAARIRRLHAQATADIRRALQPFGYYRAQVQAHLEHDDIGWRASYRIERGAPIYIRNVDIRLIGDGANDSAFRQAIEDFPLEQDDSLVHEGYEAGKRRFQAIAAERGYFDFYFTRHELVIDEAAYHADIHLYMDTGPRYRFGKITIDQDLLEPELVARYVRLAEGDPYSTSALLEAQNALGGSEYFGEVDIEADPRNAKDRAIPVHVKLTPRLKNRYNFGIGYGTDTGARGRIGWDRRHINERGHYARTELRASDIEKSLTAGYFIPIRNPRTDQIGVTANYTETDTLTAENEIRRVAISRTTTRGHLVETLSLTRQYEEFVIGNEIGDSTLLIPGVSWSYLFGNESVYVDEQGARAILDVRGASRNVASDTSFLQARLRTKYIYAFSDFGRLITRVDAGATQLADTSELPASLRFFAGGDASVRGYRYNTLGPTDADGNVVGGRHLLVGSVEYEQHIVGNWAAAIFYDKGNALNDFAEPLKEGAGIGIRWRSPIGQIRVDVASGINDPDAHWRLHLTIGPDL